ncbi:hypothetical protein JAO76_09965 [Pontibacter sp. BT310]|uniref:DUF4923 family protein n=1 Tax=Pontibacter populi TaxID=890055 RepID=A0ABS6XBK9_9BACT|nr:MULTISPECIES: hypothetical protein [Pontibacter]MBJ6118517.1 hypothetical protein [Pontibacter sp. BT310]MBR0570946.1 hypothetical protein [Microvirga sp. STS03]MBW3365371.1 DUF4923 family protein [Pontibacter populi]
MKKLKFLSYLFAALLMVTTVSCDDDDDDSVPNNTSLLTASEWTGDKVYFQGMDVTNNPLSPIDVKNVKITFMSDGTYSGQIEGISQSGTWEFNQTETQIIMDKGTDDELIVDVKKLTSTELWAEGEFADLGEDVEIRFVH